MPNEILVDAPQEVLPDSGSEYYTTLQVVPHPDYLLRWVPEETSYFVGETRPLKVGVSRVDGEEVTAPGAGSIIVTLPDLSTSAPLIPDLESILPGAEQIAAQDYTFSTAGAYRVKFSLTFGTQMLIFEQIIYISS
jgi:hypothetical protein